jgi:Phage integrase family
MKGCGVKANASRFYFISREEAQAVLDACPDAQWRLLFALSRFGGLRCPSEHLGLRWGDVDWERSRITIHSPKTEHHEGGEPRQIPMFPELRPFLEEVFEEAELGTEYVITRYRNDNANLRTQLQRIIRKAGLKPWPKLFQNLRSTRETELAESHPMHVVCSWIGNSQAVAAKHYLQVRDEDFDRASESGAESPTWRSVQRRGGAESGAQDGKTAAQKQAPPASAGSRQSPQETHNALEGQGLRQVAAVVGEMWPNCQVPPVGLEPTTL